MANIFDGTFVLGNVSATTLSAGEGIKITTDEPGVIKVSNDETVLWSGTNYSISDGTKVLSGSVELSEPASAFEKISIWTSGACSNEIIECVPRLNCNLFQKEYHEIKANKIVVAYYGRLNDWTHFSAHGSYETYSADGSVLYNGTNGWWGYSQPYKICGINRKQNGGN